MWWSFSLSYIVAVYITLVSLILSVRPYKFHKLIKVRVSQLFPGLARSTLCEAFLTNVEEAVQHLQAWLTKGVKDTKSNQIMFNYQSNSKFC